MGKREMPAIGGVEKEPLEIQGSEVQVKGSDVQGSGRFLFALAKILVDVIDDELQVSDAHKCAGKKVDNGKRVVRAVASAVSKVSNVSGQRRLGAPVICIGNPYGCHNLPIYRFP